MTRVAVAVLALVVSIVLLSTFVPPSSAHIPAYTVHNPLYTIRYSSPSSHCPIDATAVLTMTPGAITPPYAAHGKGTP